MTNCWSCALRKRFPDVCFFTTDLDAELSHKSESNTARNLVVASHFGLTLNPDLQREVPPFRDSYQTSLYFASLLALEDKAAIGALEDHHALGDPWGIREWTSSETDKEGEESKSRLNPLVFELGRHGPYQLTMTGPDTADSVDAAVHPRSPRERPWLTRVRFVALLLASLAMLACLSAFVAPVRGAVLSAGNSIRRRWSNQKKGEAIAIFAGILLLLFGPVLLIALNHTAVNGEPFAWDEGISLWPATLIRYIVVLSALFLWWLCQKDLSENESRLSEKYAGKKREKSLSLWSLIRTGLSGAFWNPRLREFLKSKTEKGKPQGDEAPILSFLYPWAWREKQNSGSNQAPGQEQQTQKQTPAKKKKKKQTKKQTKAQARAQTTKPTQKPIQKPPTATELFDEYVERGSLPFRLARSIRLSLFYLVFASVLMGAWPAGRPTRPYRGPWSNWVSEIVLLLAVVLMVWLVFFVLDRMQLCRRFVRLLQDSGADWESNEVRRLRESRGVENDDEPTGKLIAGRLVTVRVIAEHTNAVMKIIYYPFIVVLLMLVARTSLFDYLNLPVPLILIFLLLFGALVWSAYEVRLAARAAREEIISQMRGTLTKTLADKSQSPRVEQIKLFITEIQHEQRGAYGPIVRDPIVGSLALVFGGSGGLLLIQRFLPHVIF